ncbi:dihydrofolate reductase family protein [Salinicoccus roseus]|uniref:dihydrofolate reductase family protein n=1 Tax=Salinicoccus roseus TaxID=45670 RepID=UPI002300D4D0|nr:dihydrofolate reductase family protein [Salinicoccus roseus]
MARRVVLDLAVTLDGFIEGEHGEIDWCIMDPEMDFTAFLESVDTILFGRKSYDLWKSYVPEGEVSDLDKEMMQMSEDKEKIVFSRSKRGTEENAAFSDDIGGTVEKLKEQEGQNLWLYGGAELITECVNLGLVDEYRLSVHPLVLGRGKPLFKNIEGRLDLELQKVNRYDSGVVQLIYGRA